LQTPSSLLRELDKQRRFLLDQATMKTECPACRIPISMVEASGAADLDAFPAEDTSDTDFTCPHCQTKLLRFMPVMVMGARKWGFVVRGR